MTAAHKVLLTTPRFFAFEAMIREHLAEHGCEVLEHAAHDMQMKEEGRRPVRGRHGSRQS